VIRRRIERIPTTLLCSFVGQRRLKEKVERLKWRLPTAHFVLPLSKKAEVYPVE
jgi:hypothetical protein